MGSLYRSEPMTRCQIILASDAAYPCVAELGKLAVVQFVDAQPSLSPLQRKFTENIRKCDDIQRKIRTRAVERFIESEIRNAKIPVADIPHVGFENPSLPHDLKDLEAIIQRMETDVTDMSNSQHALRQNLYEMHVLKSILERADKILDDPQEAETRRMTMKLSRALTRRQQLPQKLSTEEPVFPKRLQSVVGKPPAGSELRRLLDESTQSGGGLMAEPANSESALFFLAGVIRRPRMQTFERLLWRACHGLVFLRYDEVPEPLKDPFTGEEILKNVIFMFFEGNELKDRVKKICDGFHVKLYHVPETARLRKQMAANVNSRLKDLDVVIERADAHKADVLKEAGKHVLWWHQKVQKKKAIYTVMNLFNGDVTPNCLVAECWIPVYAQYSVQQALKRGTDNSDHLQFPPLLQTMETADEPPTHFRTNRFTEGFQAIVDAYGVAGYGEINPAIFTIISFPFLFAVMFGDAGHGVLMFLFALALVLKEKELKAKRIQDEIFQTFFGGRYIILLMGLFSIYVGLIYNDVFSRPTNLFGSSWKANYDTKTLEHHEHLMLDPNSTAFNNQPYPFGFDPVWLMSENKLLFFNSFKMKMSVTVGVLQMMFGVLLGLLNHVHFRRVLNILCQSLPEILFLCSIFLYLCVMILFKWLCFGTKPLEANGYPGSNCAPSLLIGLINVVMLNPREENFHGKACHLAAFYPFQNMIEKGLVFLALICVPWMLIIKPAVLVFKQHRKKKDRHDAVELKSYRRNGKDIEAAAELLKDGQPTEADGCSARNNCKVSLAQKNAEALPAKQHEESAGDLFIHQAIHTIEFTLGCVSHTASYLRLWALSLAHAELSEVLWHMVLSKGFNLFQGHVGAVVVYVAFAAFACLTIAILVLMEGLSAFLHALRLHWVEFNSKFYSGSGHAFVPFSLAAILEKQMQLAAAETDAHL